MRIAFILPPDHDALAGGHTVQRTKTQEYLEARGHQVKIVTDVSSIHIDDIDLLHFWSLEQSQIQAVADYPLPKVLTPIYIAQSVVRQFVSDSVSNLHLYAGRARSHLATAVKRTLGFPLLPSRRKELAYALQHCDLFLPNSEGEAIAVYHDTGATTPYYVIPNAADMAFSRAIADPFIANYGLQNFVLCAARFEPLKNQLRLVEALKGAGLVLVLVGEPHPHHQDYFRRCWAHFGLSVIHIPKISHEELASVYAAARVSVLPSFYETTGLVSLEAGLAGINVVTTDRGYTREYFEDLVWYCDPASTRSIRRAVIEAFEAPVKTALREKILRCYTWDITADRTIAAYQRAIELHGSKSGRLEGKDLVDAV